MKQGEGIVNQKEQIHKSRKLKKRQQREQQIKIGIEVLAVGLVIGFALAI